MRHFSRYAVVLAGAVALAAFGVAPAQADGPVLSILGPAAPGDGPRVNLLGFSVLSLTTGTATVKQAVTAPVAPAASAARVRAAGAN
ncbi:hypothetical protein ACWDYJ_15585 [Streptomyces sp. NPDC003042]